MGERVRFEFEEVPQDGYLFRAVVVTTENREGRTATEAVHETAPAFESSVRIVFDHRNAGDDSPLE